MGKSTIPLFIKKRLLVELNNGQVIIIPMNSFNAAKKLRYAIIDNIMPILIDGVEYDIPSTEVASKPQYIL